MRTVAAGSGPYRQEAHATSTDAALVFVRAHRAAMLRLLAGALGCVYLAAWTHGWEGGAWPQHVWWIDVVFATQAVIWVKRLRDPMPLVWLGLTAVHAAGRASVVPVPSSVLQWGAWCLGSVLPCWRCRWPWRCACASGP